MNSSQPGSQEQICFHCGLPAPNDSQYQVDILGAPRPMCCPGCEAIANNIIDIGMESYYKHRDTTTTERKPGEVIPDFLLQNDIWNEPSLQKRFVRPVTEPSLNSTLNSKEEKGSELAITLMISGITCAACIWLIEQQLQKLPGITLGRVSLSSHLAEIEWNKRETDLSNILYAIHKIGYQAEPYSPQKQEAIIQHENKKALARIGVAGLGAMQVMMFAGGLYLGAFQGIAAEHEQFLRWVSAIVCFPVYLYAGYPFLSGAIRNIKTRHAGMDIPVAIAITSAFTASLWSTATQGEEVYFDSVCMFVLFLSVGRYLEMRARHRSLATTIRISHRTTLMATKEDDDGNLNTIIADQLLPGDRIRVKAGDTIPGDGFVTQGTAAVNESMLTGEELPVTKSKGDFVTGGTITTDQPLSITIQHQSSDSILSGLQRLLEKAQSHKPGITIMADKVASYFVIAVLSLSIIVFTAWYYIDPQAAFWITLSVLVVTCPCALSLATPAAMTASASTLANLGFITANSRFSETANQITDVVFDKTGTLTYGAFTLVETYIYPGANLTAEQAFAIAAGLENHSEHPIAKAFTRCDNSNASNAIAMNNVSVKSNQGIIGQHHNTTYKIGTRAFASPPLTSQSASTEACSGQWVWLSDSHKLLARFNIEDAIRKDSPRLIDFFNAQGYQLHILSGDSSDHPKKVGNDLGIADVITGASPQCKLDTIQTLQQQGKKVLMIGDGLNDAPVLAAADCSVSMSNGTDLAKIAADGLLISPKISTLIPVFHTINKTYRIIKQNLTWALLYNICALPAAIAGWVPPWLAAIGMSTSSLIVVFNALRIQRTDSTKHSSTLTL